MCEYYLQLFMEQDHWFCFDDQCKLSRLCDEFAVLHFGTVPVRDHGPSQQERLLSPMR